MNLVNCIKGAKKLRCAVVFAAHLVFAPAAFAQEVVFRSSDPAIEVQGQFVAFDGEVVTLRSDAGLLSFRSELMTCEGSGCPDLAGYVPQLRMVGASRIVDILLPALIEVYARDHGWQLKEDASGFRVTRSDETPVLTVTLEAAPPQQAFDRFVTSQADVLLSMRELRENELSRAASAGLGPLNTTRQARIIALDALVPVTSLPAEHPAISISDLVAALAGQSGQYHIDLPTEMTGQLEGFEDRFMRPFGLSLVSDTDESSQVGDALSDVAPDRNVLSLRPFRETGSAQSLALTGPCGLHMSADFLTLKTEDYPLTFPMFLYLPRRNQHPQIVDFLDWLRSPAAQLVIRRAGFADLASVPIPLSDQGERLANAISSAGEEIQLTELQRMVRVLSSHLRLSTTFRFEPGSTRLDGQSRSNVMQLAQSIRDGRFTGRSLLFVGFSDGRGPALANRDLSSARAEAVKRDVLRALGGVIPDTVSFNTAAFGEALPMGCDDTVWGQQINRRVELWVRDQRD